MNICAQRRLPKIQACRAALQNNFNSIDVDTFEYDEYVCKKIQIYFEGEQRQKYNPNKSLYVLQCPPTISVIHSRREKYFILYYLSSNLQQNSVILSKKINIKGENIVPIDIDNNIDVQFISQDRARARFIPYPSIYERRGPVYRKSYSKIDSQVNAVASYTVQMPVTLAQIEGIQSRSEIDIQSSLRVSINRWLAEDVLIEFSKVKKNKLSKYWYL